MASPRDAHATHRKLNPAEWAEVTALYELGKAHNTALALQFGISRQAIHRGLKNRGAVYGKRSGVIEEAVVESFKTQATRDRDEIQAMKVRQRKQIELIQALTIKEITGAVKDRVSIGTRRSDVATLRSAMAIMATGRNELYHIYDLIRDPDGAEEIPEFIVGEYTSDEIDALNRERLGVSDDRQNRDRPSAVIIADL